MTSVHTIPDGLGHKSGSFPIVLMASAFVSYIGPFNMSYRQAIMKDKFAKFFKDNKIPVSDNLNPLEILTTEAE